MGESIVAGSTEKTKMGKTGAADPALEVSVSFGRFENDYLSWEKWSSFSPNKYLEEVEKCATPGSVAMKKAYFEAHYKKIAARKTELQDQAHQMEEDHARSAVRNGGELITRTSRTATESNESSSGRSVEVVNHIPKVEDEDREGAIDNQNNYAATRNYGQDLTAEEVKAEYDGALDKAVLSNLEEAASANGEVSPSVESESEDVKELPENLKEESKPEESIPVQKVESLTLGQQDTKDFPNKQVGEIDKILPLKKDVAKSGHTNVSQKIIPISKVREVASAKKKPLSPATKVSQISTPKVSRPMPAATALSTSRSSTKKIGSSSLPRNTTQSSSRTKQAAVKSLHMSISLDTPDSTPTTTRHSLIMEKMKDKDIIKRAFKTFQSNLTHSTDARASVLKQVPAKEVEAKASTIAPRKDNGGSRMFAGMEKRIAKAAPTSLSSERDKRPERESLYSGTPKKLAEKSMSRNAESARPQAKTKTREETEIKKLRQSLNFKATPMPAFYRSNKVTKNPLHKEGSKTFGL